MKKITLISSAILALLVVSCQKENIAPTPNGGNTNNFTNHIFKCKKEIKVYDKTSEHFVSVELQSDNESIVNNAFEYYKGMEMVFVYDKPSTRSIENKPLNDNLNIKPESNRLPTNEDFLAVKFNIVNKGNSIGYKFVPKENSRTYTTTLYFNFSIAYSATCNYFYVSPNYGKITWVLYQEYYNGSWHTVQDYRNTIWPGSGVYFSGATYGGLQGLQLFTNINTAASITVFY